MEVGLLVLRMPREEPSPLGPSPRPLSSAAFPGVLGDGVPSCRRGFLTASVLSLLLDLPSFPFFSLRDQIQTVPKQPSLSAFPTWRDSMCLASAKPLRLPEPQFPHL